MGTAAALSVRCLGCGQVYVKPLDGASATGSGDCPACGYLGWIPAGQALTPASEPPRYASDPPRRLPWRGR
jgi:hypothetical protein